MKIFNNDKIADIIVPSATLNWSVGSFIEVGQYSNVFLSAVNINEAEVVDIRKCFDDVTHIYAFGRDLDRSTISMTVQIMVGVKCHSGMAGELKLQELYSKYDENRIFKKQSSLPIQVDDFVQNGFLVGLQVSTVDPLTNMASATFIFIPDKAR